VKAATKTTPPRQRIVPCLAYADAGAAIDFLRRAFGSFATPTVAAREGA
jgi:hypothetical protein